MTVEGRWEELEQLYRENTCGGEALRSSLENLFNIPGGFDLLIDKLKKSKKVRTGLLPKVTTLIRDNLFPWLDSTPRGRSTTVEKLLAVASARSPQHWHLLDLWHQNRFPCVGQKVIEALEKFLDRKNNLGDAIPTIIHEGWLRPKQLASLLQEARTATTDDQLQRALDRGINSLKQTAQDTTGSIPATETKPNQDTTGSIPATETKPNSVPPPEPAACSTEPATAAGPVAVPASIQGSAKVVPAPQTKPRPPRDSPELRHCLETVQEAIRHLLLEQSGRLERLELELEQSRDSEKDWRRKCRERDEDLAALRPTVEKLEAQRQKLLGEQVDLEDRLRQREADLRTARQEIATLQKNLAEAREEIVRASARADEYIELANQEKVTAIAGFQGKLWERLRPCLREILREQDESTLNEEQRFFRNRLREIRAALREQGVPPSES